MAAYYNEIEPYAAQWLRNLIKKGLIADGEVDTRSVVDVAPDDLRGFTQAHFFAGIGGWSHALRLAGWPDDRPIWTGSCPCQPFSVAGKGAGVDDPRHLWPHFHRLISSVRPPVVMGEQVAGAAGYGWLDGVRADLERENYASRGVDIPACAVDAPHIRQRLYWVASDLGNADDAGLEGRGSAQCGELRENRQIEPRGVYSDVAHPSNNGAGRDIGASGNGGRGSLDAGAAGLRQAHGQGGADRPNPRSAGYMADADNAKRCPRAEGRRDDDDGQNARREEEASGRQLGSAADHSHMADASSAGLQSSGNARERPKGMGSSQPSRDSSFWSDAIWLTGADGKARRAQPGIPLLAHGIPNRVGKLRAYGNAIVAPLAAQVIGAYLDAEKPCGGCAEVAEVDA
jgi:DNA (cytosine-5)-methyltransferase 1